MTQQQDISERIALSNGLEGHDDDLELLMKLFDQLQLLSPDVADPQLDLLTFAHSAYYFGVITELPEKPAPIPEIIDGFVVGGDVEQGQSSTSKHPTVVNSSQSAGPPLFEELEKDVVMDEHYTFDPFADAEAGNQQRGSSNSGALNLEVQPTNVWDHQPPAGVLGSGTLPEVYLSPIPDKRPTVIGLVYLFASQHATDYLRSGELNIGIVLDENFRNKGYAFQIIKTLLEIAFRDVFCHRIQAILIDGWAKDRALSLFMKSGFGHEGTRRRAFRSPYDNEWKDATYLGILATDFMVRTTSRSKFKIAPKSLWDELFARHQRECEELLRWEEKNLKRSSSTETIRESRPLVPFVDSDAATDCSETLDRSPSKKRRVRSPVSSESGRSGDEYDASASETESDDDLDTGIEGWARVNAFPDYSSRLAPRDQSPAFTDKSDVTSEDSDGYMSSSSQSQWDILETTSDSDFNYQMLNIDDEM